MKSTINRRSRRGPCMRSLIVLYRLVYAMTLVLFLIHIVQGFGAAAVNREDLFGSLVAACALLGSFYFTLSFNKSLRGTCWAVITLWCASFVWYAWCSQSSPFLLRELHSVDYGQALQESRRHELLSGTLFAVLLLWFLSLPLIRQRSKNGVPCFPGGLPTNDKFPTPRQ